MNPAIKTIKSPFFTFLGIVQPNLGFFTIMKKLNSNVYIAIMAMIVLVIHACSSSKSSMMVSDTIVLDTLNVQPEVKGEYRASHKKDWDILHMKLDLKFNWDSAFVMGEALLTVKPYFYPSNTLILDAKSFKVESFGFKKGNVEIKEMSFDYKDDQIIFTFKDELTREDTIQLLIEYVAMPDKREVGGSFAISMDKGMYFINKDDSDPNKPRQLWTQGETEANSCWFPTIDKPNEKFTTDIYVTIEEGHTSISNGLKMFSVSNNDGTKTEYWKMDKPHAAYLVMLAVGPFAEYKDKWGEMEVNYYLDSSYLQYADDIFGNTPEMLTFYSEYLGVPYPWQKYDQVVVHDYVSGAMENTTATIHGEFLQQTDREMYDYDHEDVIAHELFHHWFGDLVTCESWSNLTLNEGFATYGEYLWEEHHLGRDIADINFTQNWSAYQYESQEHKVDMIRFYYDDKEDMFDSHSYSKGGLILHMLRGYVGDEAFRAALKHYLTKHAFQSVEIHDLRIAFEEVTGEDMNWFFNQWFLAAGHPILDIDIKYNERRTEAMIIVEQNQDTEKYPLYKLPVDIIYPVEGFPVKKRYVIDQQTDTILITSVEAITYINFDPGNYLVAEVEINQGDEDWMAMYRGSKLGIDKYRAIMSLEDSTEKNMDFYAEVIKEKNWELRWSGLKYFTELNGRIKSDSLAQVIKGFVEDPRWNIRYMAINHLAENYDGDEMADIYLKGIGDSSLWVTNVSIKSLAKVNNDLARSVIDTIGGKEYGTISSAIADVYMVKGDGADHEKLAEVIENVEGYYLFQTLDSYEKYLGKIEIKDVYPAIPLLKKLSLDKSSPWWVRMMAQNSAMSLHSRLKDEFKGDVDELSKKYGAETPTQLNFDEGSAHGIYLAQTEMILKEVQKEETRSNLVSTVTNYLEKNAVLKD